MLIHISDNDVENYWMVKGFYALTLEIKNDLVKLKELTFTLLEKQENALYKSVQTPLFISFFIKYFICINGLLIQWIINCLICVYPQAL